MIRLLKREVDISFLVNPFYLYGSAFLFAIFLYSWGWSDLFPRLSAGLYIFFAVTSALSAVAGFYLWKWDYLKFSNDTEEKKYDVYLFVSIITLGILNVLIMGYIPLFDSSHDYREFGARIIDPVFNTMSIFFSLSFIHSYLQNKKKRHLIFILIILIFQILLYRRSTIVWIILSSLFLLFYYKRKIRLIMIIAGIALIPLFSYAFGFYGSERSSLSESDILVNFKAAESFKESGLSPNFYMTYLYISSPLANLQKNLDEDNGLSGRGDFKNFFFYSLVPQTLVSRSEKLFNLTPPDCKLITPYLIVGTLFMESFYTMGWIGMGLTFVYLILFISGSLLIIKRWDSYSMITLSLLSTTVVLMIFSNFLNRLDVILMLFIYPFFFHLLLHRKQQILN